MAPINFNGSVGIALHLLGTLLSILPADRQISNTIIIIIITIIITIIIIIRTYVSVYLRITVVFVIDPVLLRL